MAGRVEAIWDAELHLGDCLTVLPTLADNSVDSCVSDPPYHLTSIVKRFGSPTAAPAQHGTDGAYARASRGFMGKTWDGGNIAFDPSTWAEVLRVLKPGAHLLAFGGTRTYHRLACAIEDAGFEVRDQVGWLYGSGFPKSHNQRGEWEGWGTALKPAWEPIVLARKPLIGTVSQNLESFCCGAIHIDACRVPMNGEVVNTGQGTSDAIYGGGKGLRPVDLGTQQFTSHDLGRWPANIIHDGSDEVVAVFPNADGAVSNGKKRGTGFGEGFGVMEQAPSYADSGSAARFFYCAKASQEDRNDGCDGLPLKQGGMLSETSGQHITRRDGGAPGLVRNNHPTVKPTDLMRYLCRLVTPPKGIVIDPFMGSGSTGRGAALEGFRFIGIEREPEYFDIACSRVRAASAQPSLDLSGEAA